MITVKITPRQNCPDANDCHCSLTVVSGSRTFKLCGTNDVDAVSCEVLDPGVTCFTIDGLEHSSFVLNSTTPSELFCMVENTGLEVSKTNSGNATLTISCQIHETNPQSLNMTFSGPGKKYFEVNGDCEVAVCD